MSDGQAWAQEEMIINDKHSSCVVKIAQEVRPEIEAITPNEWAPTQVSRATRGEWKCVTCAYAFFEQYMRDNNGKLVPGAYGQCRYNPPFVEGFPRITEATWCGKHEPK